jgi:hypothetical protein
MSLDYCVVLTLLASRLRLELLPFDPTHSDLRANCAVAQFAKPPTPLRSAEWGTLHGDLGSRILDHLKVKICDAAWRFFRD